MDPPNSAADEPLPNNGTKKQKQGEKKRYFCTVAGCNRDYSRAEHLYRHQLNHNPKEIFRCKYAGCGRAFVRQDLCSRHQERHFARARQEQASTDNRLLRSADAPDETSAIVASASSLGSTRSPTQERAHLPPSSPSDSGEPDSSVHRDGDKSVEICEQHAASEPQGAVTKAPASPLLEPGQTTLAPQYLGLSVPNHQMAPLPYSPPQSGRRMTDSSLNARLGLNGGNIQFGDGNLPFSDSNIQFSDSPTSVRDEFTSWLFDDINALPAINYDGLGLMATTDGFGNPIYPSFFDDSEFDNMLPMLSPGSTAGQSISWSATSTAGMGFSEEKRQAILSFMDARFIEDDSSEAGDRLKEELYQGNRDHDDHPLSLASMHSYVRAFWLHFNDQFPILHRPTFCADETNVQLLLAVMIIGASHIDNPGSAGAKAFAYFCAQHLRWQVFRHPDSRPPAKLWVFQTLVLLEVFEKAKSSRALHERSNVHSPTTITLMRRGTALVNDQVEDPNHHKPTSPEQWWRRWIQTEATRRAAFVAFILDAYFSVMFGHNSVMSVHEIHLPLPCDDALWSATSAAEVARVEASLHANGVKAPTFTEAMKRIMTGRKVTINNFGRTILMAGMFSVIWHMQQRDLQMNVLGMSRERAGGLPNNWKEPLEKSIDFWKKDFDDSLTHMQQASLPWQHHQRKSLQAETRQASGILSHLAHMFLHVDFRDCQMVAGASSIGGKPVTDRARATAKTRLRDWASSSSGRSAVFHALQCLREIFLDPSHDSGPRYRAANDHQLVRPWAFYIAGLIIFTWGYITDGLLRPFPSHLLRSPRAMTVLPQDWEVTDQVRNAAYQDAQLYLSTIGSVTSPQELDRIKAGRNNVVGLLRTLEFAFQDAKWELLQEASVRLQGAVLRLER
ncbi:hypothetical protein DV735_g5605, partial [Chaetothyriales sp. CBS 134920]